MAQLTALLGSADRLLILHLLSLREFPSEEIVRVTGRSRRRVEGFLAELVDAGAVVAVHRRGRCVYKLASRLIRDLVSSLVALDQATCRQRQHLRLVHSSDAEPVPAGSADSPANGRDLREERQRPLRPCT